MLSTPPYPPYQGGKERVLTTSAPPLSGGERDSIDFFSSPIIRGVMGEYFASALFLTKGTMWWCFATNSPYKKYFTLIVWYYNNLKINQKLLVCIFSKNKTWIKKTKFYTYRSIIVNLDKNLREYGSEN